MVRNALNEWVVYSPVNTVPEIMSHLFGNGEACMIAALRERQNSGCTAENHFNNKDVKQNMSPILKRSWKI